MFEYESKHYDAKTDDLFLVYTAIDDSFNKNGWKVENIDKNITTGLGRPGIIKPKDPNNPHEAEQDGNFIHPVFPNAPLQTLLQNQESYSIARAVRLDKPSTSSPWRVWLQITDPTAKLALKNASVTPNQYPRYISPQVITFPSDYPDEDAANVYKHWIISHWAFVDIPAYGEQMKIRGKCYGDLNNCKVKLQNASSGNHNFCVKEAIRVLSSSHNTNSPTSSIMAENSNANSNNTGSQPVQPNTNSQVGQISYAWQPVVQPTISDTINTTKQITPGSSKQEAEPGTDQQKPGMEKGDTQTQKPVNKEEEKDAGRLETTDDLKKVISELKRKLADQETRTKAIEEDNIIRKQNEKRWQVSAKVAKYSNAFKSKDSFEKEVDIALRFSGVMTEEELEQYLDNKYNIEAPIPKPRSAATITTTTHEVPTEHQANNASLISSSNNKKFIELLDMFESAGGST